MVTYVRVYFFLWKMKKERKHSVKQQEAIDFVSNRLKDIRKSKGYSNYDILAYDLGMSRAQYGTYENGSNITIATLAKILDQLGVSFEEFFSNKN